MYSYCKYIVKYICMHIRTYMHTSFRDAHTYGTFHKKLNDVGRLSGGHYPTVSGRSEVGQRSVSGRSTVGH